MERIEYSWEKLPVVLAAQEYSRCLGRIFASLPDRVARKTVVPMTRAAVQMGASIVGCNLDIPPGEEELTVEEQAAFRREALEALRTSRVGVRRLQKRRHGDQDEVNRALELLDQTEMWLNAPASEDVAVH